MTPRQYRLLNKRFRQYRTWEHSLAAQVCAVTANYSMCHPKEPYSVADFLPEMRHKVQNKANTIEEQNSALVQYLIATGTAKVVKESNV